MCVNPNYFYFESVTLLCKTMQALRQKVSELESLLSSGGGDSPNPRAERSCQTETLQDLENGVYLFPTFWDHSLKSSTFDFE